jgi:DNA polymerase-3 subunit alpha
LVADAQHRVARSGNKFGIYTIEDYSGKMEFPLFSEDYLKISPYLQQGSTVYLTGFLKQRYNKSEFEFKVQQVSLAETLKRNLTRQVNIQVNPKDLSEDMIGFVEKNMKNFPGQASLRFILADGRNKWKISLVNTNSGFEMNDEMIRYLQEKPELDVQIVCN